MKKSLKTSKQYFTLIELLVVVAILAILMSLLSPALHKAIYRAKIVGCQSNLKSVGMGLLLYGDDNGDFYPNPLALSARTNAQNLQILEGKKNRGAYAAMLPYYLGGGEELNGPTPNGFEAAFSCPIVVPSGEIDNPDVVWSHLSNRGKSMPTYYTNLIPFQLYFGIGPINNGYLTEQMNRIGESWRWNGSSETKYCKGPKEATSYTYNILAADVLRYGSWYGSGGTHLLSNHIIPGQKGEAFGGPMGTWGGKSI